MNSSKWKSTFSPISDINLTKTVDNPLQTVPSLSQNSLFAFRPPSSEDSSASETKGTSHARKHSALSTTGSEGLGQSTNSMNGFAHNGGLPGDIGLHSFIDGASLPHKATDVMAPVLGSSSLGFLGQRNKEAGVSEMNPFLGKRQLESLGISKGEDLNWPGPKSRESSELGVRLSGSSEKALVLHNGKIGKGRERDVELKNGHNIFIAAATATVPSGGLLNGKGLSTAATIASPAASSAQTHHPFLNSLTTGSQFSLSPMVTNASVLQSLFSSMPATGLVHVSSAATRLTNSHTMGSFSPGVTGGTVGGKWGLRCFSKLSGGTGSSLVYLTTFPLASNYKPFSFKGNFFPV